MNTKTIVWFFTCIIIFCVLWIALMIARFLTPKYESGIATSFESIKELNEKLEDFPVTGEIEYFRRSQAGTIGILFVGKADSDAIKQFCDRHACLISPAKEYKQEWESRFSLYQVSDKISTAYQDDDIHFDGPEVLHNSDYRLSFLYMPSKQTFIGEIFYFR